jgi:hypothetical protein
MPKRVTTVSTTVVRDGKRVDIAAGKPYNFTEAEIRDLNTMHPGALRKGVNETAAEPADESAPAGTAEATSDKTPKTPAKKKAAAKDSTSKAATDDDKADAGNESSSEGDAPDEDDDI